MAGAARRQTAGLLFPIAAAFSGAESSRKNFSAAANTPPHFLQ
jgi:hypothetical protein